MLSVYQNHTLSLVARLIWAYVDSFNRELTEKVCRTQDVAEGLNLDDNNVNEEIEQLIHTKVLSGTKTESGAYAHLRTLRAKARKPLKASINDFEGLNPVLTFLKAYKASYARFCSAKPARDASEYPVARAIVKTYGKNDLNREMEAFFKSEKHTHKNLTEFAKWLRKKYQK